MISLFQRKLPILEHIKDFLATLLYLSFVVFSNDAMGVYFMVALVLLIFALNAAHSKQPIFTRIGLFHRYMLWISLYCFVSALWAWNPDYAVEKGLTIFELLIAFSLLYECYKNSGVDRLLTIIMWGGFFLSIYTFFFYGIDNLQDTIEEGERLENGFANINTVAMTCSSSIIIAYYLFKKRLNVLDILLCLPCLLVVASSGSRKAFVMLVAGVIALSVFYSNSKKKNSNKLLTIIGYVFMIIAVSFFIAKSGIFAGTIERMDEMMPSLTGKSEADSSSMIRAYYRYIGFEQFLKTPILGIGIGNGVLLALQHTGRFCYLHCNYAEIAACGGIVGLYIVYWIYFKLIKMELRYVKKDPAAVMMLIFLFMNLIMDYGSVSYYGKETYFMFMIFCIHYDSLKSRNAAIKFI